MKKVLSLFFLLVITFLFIRKGLIGLDPDFGWHLKSGEYILSSGFPQTDPFSYTMPSFPFIDHAWGTSVLIAYFLPIIGVVGLSILFSLVSIATLMLITLSEIEKGNIDLRKGVNQFIFSPIALISLALFFPFFFIRAQVFSWLLWAVFLVVFLHKSIWNKYKYVLPVLFIIWVNLHGGFAIGIFSLVIYVLVRTVQRNIRISDFLVVGASIVATFLNPYGVSIWEEVFMTVSSPLLRTNIGEWKSLFVSPDLVVFCFMTFSTVCIGKYWKKFQIDHLFLFSFLLVQSVISLKNIPFWALLAVPMTAQSLRYFYKEVVAIPHGKERFQMAEKILLKIFLCMFVIEIYFGMHSAYEIREEHFYPEKAILYLKENSPNGEVFSEYGWGGYLIWKYPEKKVFIDGRMAIWRRRSAPENELPNAFETYVNIGKGEESYRDVFEKFNVSTVLWPKGQDKKQADVQIEKITNFLEKLLGEKNDFDFLESLEENGWEKVYEDDLAVIFQKNE